MDTVLDRHEVIVIGGGQARLALGYPTRDEVIDYLTAYARDFELSVELNVRFRNLAFL